MTADACMTDQAGLTALATAPSALDEVLTRADLARAALPPPALQSELRRPGLR